MALVVQGGWQDAFYEMFSGSVTFGDYCLPHPTKQRGCCGPQSTVPGPDLNSLISWRHLTVLLSFFGTMRNQIHLDVSS